MRVQEVAGRVGPDPLLATGILVLGQVEAVLASTSQPRWQQALLTLVWSVPLVWRRRWPIAVLAVVIAVGPFIELVNEQGGVTSYVLAAMLAAFTVGRELDPPASWWGPALTIGASWTIYLVTDGMLSDFVFVALLYGGMWGVGAVLRQRAQHVHALADETELLRATARDRERLAVEAERTRIARELHDVVSHGISVITVQTQAVRRRLGPAHPEAEALASVESTARQAMAEMRRLLGVLRASDDPLDLSPQPGLAQLQALVEEVRATGMRVDLVREGTPVVLPPGLDLTAYRVVQEGLTNACKHASTAQVTVRLAYGADSLVVSVDDDGSAVPDTDSGHGLIGMRERVQLYRGSLATRTRPGGGFGVRATLPLRVTSP